MEKKRVFFLIFSLYLIAYLGHAFILRKVVYGDGVFYYSYLRSLIIDRDLDFSNDYRFFAVTQPLTPSGYLANKYSIGPALFWTPFFYTMHLFSQQSGFEFIYQLSAGLSSVLLVVSGLCILYTLIRKFYPKDASIYTIISVAFATNLFFYGSLDPVNSHALSFFTSCTFLYLLFQQKKQYFLLGLFLGLCALMRFQDCIIGILLIPFINWKKILNILIGFIFSIFPQIIIIQKLYGNMLVVPYFFHGEGFSLFRPHIMSVLFSLQNGLFLWTPIIFIGFCALLAMRKKYKLLIIKNLYGKNYRTVYFSLIPLLFLFQLYSVSSWSTWSQGASYSGRMFVSILPILSLGMAEIYARISNLKVVGKYCARSITLSLCTINVLCIASFLLIH